MQPLRHTFAKWCISTVPSALLTLAVALTILNFLFTSSARAEGVIYVKPGGVGAKNGVDWANAADLTTALAGASSGDELWVAAGTYKPTTTSADLRDAAFTLKAGVAVYGGFAGTETLRSQRNWATHVVILSGDLNGNDGPDFANNDENSYHVVIGATGATLDGVTITAGNANVFGCPGPGCGGGVYNIGSSPTLSNVTISGNFAFLFGGGVYNEYSSPTLTNVVISGNAAQNGGGGGMRNYSYSSPTLTSVIISGNSAFDGGGLSNENLSSPALTNVTISGNSAQSRGGGLSNANQSSPALTNVIISGNSASWGDGGGVYNNGISSPTLTNVTISGNVAQNGGGVYNDSSSSPLLRNSIIWGNSSPITNFDTEFGTTITLITSLVQGGCPDVVSTCTNILDADPLFETAVPAAPSTGGDLHLQLGSPAINVGDNGVSNPPLPATDRDGEARISGGSVDLGAYEQAPVVVGITRADLTNPTNAATLHYTVTFNTPVTGVDAADFSLTRTGGQDVANTQISAVSGTSPTTTWTVTVTTTDNAAGIIRLDLIDNDTIVSTDNTPVPLGGLGVGNGSFAAGEIYTVDRLRPTVAFSSAAPEPTKTSPISVTVTFSESVGDFIAADITPTNATVSNFSGSGTTYSFDLTPSGQGLVQADIAAGIAQDAVGNGNSAATTFSRTYDTIVPTVAFSSAAPDVVRTSPILVTVTFSESVGDFTAADITSTNATISNFSGSGTTYSFDLAPNGPGTVQAAIAAGVAHDAAGNANTAATAFSRAYMPSPGVIYVKPGGVGAKNGVDWANAADLAAALAGASSGDELWVAAGTYKPSTSTTDRNATFGLRDGVAVYGGFAGTETARAQRNWTTNVVTLSGDLAGDDGPNFANNGENSLHVVIGANGATLDGVTITAGNASINGAGACPGQGCGGAMQNVGVSPTLNNVIISGNHGVTGGGMANWTSNAVLSNVIISGNTATNGGGAMYNVYANVVLTNVTISGNSDSAGRGGLYNDGGSPQMRNSIIWGNGTAILNDSGATPAISYSLIEGGYSGTGNLDADPLFVAPAAPGSSGDLRLQVGSPAINAGNNAVSNPALPTTDLDGKARISGGSVDMGAYERGLVPAVVSITRADPKNPTNAALLHYTVTFNTPVTGVDATDFSLTRTGGQDGASTQISAVSNTGAPAKTWTVTVTTTDSAAGTIRLALVDNDTIVSTDSSPVPLGGLGAGNGSFAAGETYTVDRIRPTVAFSSSSGDPITGTAGIPVTVSFSKAVTGFDQSDLQVTNATVSNFSGSGTTYTCILTPLTAGLVTATIDAQAAQDAVGNGNSAASPFTRPFQPTPPPDGRRYVNYAATGTNTGRSWINAYTSLTTALLDRGATEIWIAEGTYRPGTTLTSNFWLRNKLAIYGGFAGNETDLTQRRWSDHKTILDGDHKVCHVVTSISTDATAILDGVTISNGGSDACVGDNNHGGGLFNMRGSPTLRNLIFENNSGWSGAGMHTSPGNPTLTNIVFKGNHGLGGGGLYIGAGNVTMTGVSFKNNVASYGGGLYMSRGNLTLTDARFEGNEAVAGGGLFNSGDNFAISTIQITNAVFRYNKATTGGGLAHYSRSARLLNVTFYANSADQGGGVYSKGKDFSIINSLLWGNTAAKNSASSQLYGGTNITTSVIQGSVANNGSLDPKPDQFGHVTDPRLQIGTAQCPATDLLAMTRAAPCTVGAYEFTGQPVNTIPEVVMTGAPAILRGIGALANAELTWNTTDGPVTLDIPQTALAQPIWLFYNPAEATAPALKAFTLSALNYTTFEPLPDLAFTAPVTLSIPYANDGSQRLELRRYDHSTGVWTSNESEVLEQNATGLTIRISRVGEYALFPVPLEVWLEARVSSPDGIQHLPGNTQLTYQLTVTNPGVSSASGVVVSDTLPPGVTFVSWITQGGASIAGGTITWQPAAIPPGGSASISFLVQASGNAAYQGQTIVNVANYTLGNKRGSALVAFSLNGPPQAAPVEVTTPPNTARLIAPLLTGVSNPDGSPLTLSIGTPQHGTATLAGTTLIYTPTNGFLGTDTFTYTVQDGSFSADAEVRVRVVDQAFPFIAQTANTLATELFPGQTVTYTLSIGNGTEAALHQGTLVYTLPAGLSFGQWLTQDTATVTNDTITWNIGDLLVDSTRAIRFTVVVARGAESSHIASTARLTAANSDPLSDTVLLYVGQFNRVYLPLLGR